MRVIEPSARIMDEIDGAQILRKIERCARTCYQSMDKAGDGTAVQLVRSCITQGHESVLEHVSVSVLFQTDRAVHNEMVRHRLTAVSCESTRFCNYADGITVILPLGMEEIDLWFRAMHLAEGVYRELVDKKKMKPQEARAVLPLSLKCEYVVTANLREWRHIFSMRCAKNAHPEMRRVMAPLLEEFRRKIPVVFDDLFTNGELEDLLPT